jgi:Kef-type K+ transport system membrane component KefB
MLSLRPAPGLITPREGDFDKQLLPLLEVVTTEVFLPLYFALNGIRTDLGTLNTIR